jgi:hypothetical protein
VLLLADISGYSAYLAGVELTHSTDIVAGLLESILDQTSGLLELAKLEGDCAFLFDARGDASGFAVLSAIDSAYAAFVARRLNIVQASTCGCNACRRTGELDLKFIVHAGEWVAQDMGGNIELVGPDVVLAHRLLKNDVVASTAFERYALVTGAAVAALELDPDALDALEYCYPGDLEQVRCIVIDVARRWREHQDAHPIFVSPDESMLTFSCITYQPVAVAWEYATSAAKQLEWLADSVDEQHPKGSPGPGSVSHCVHGRLGWANEIVDWRPYRYYSFRTIDKTLGRFTSTLECTPLEHGGCRLEWRTRADGGVGQRLLLRMFAGKQKAILTSANDRLQALLDGLDAA